MVTAGKFDSVQMEKFCSVVYPPNDAEIIFWAGGNIPALNYLT